MIQPLLTFLKDYYVHNSITVPTAEALPWDTPIANFITSTPVPAQEGLVTFVQPAPGPDVVCTESINADIPGYLPSPLEPKKSPDVSKCCDILRFV